MKIKFMDAAGLASKGSGHYRRSWNRQDDSLVGAADDSPAGQSILVLADAHGARGKADDRRAPAKKPMTIHRLLEYNPREGGFQRSEDSRCKLIS